MAWATVEARPTDYAGRIVADRDVSGSRTVGPAISDLQQVLKQMNGVAYEVTAAADGPSIQLVKSARDEQISVDGTSVEGVDLDSFEIKGDRDRLVISSGSEQGLSHGIYFYLEQLGVRWLMPGPNWTVVPKRADVTLTIDRAVSPAFKVRSYAGTGGFHSYKWGKKYSGSDDRMAKTTDWKRRLRYGGGYRLGKHVGEAFIADPNIFPILERHRDYLATVGGAPSPLYVPARDGSPRKNITAKINAGNPAAVELFCSWVIEKFRKDRLGPDPAARPVTSVEPSDGFGYGDAVPGQPGNGSGSDQSFHIANECAKRARQEFPGSSVIILAYAGHAAPPSFPLEPNVIVQLAPYAFQGTPPKQFIEQWSQKATKFTLYDYWSIPDWTSDEPSFDYRGLAEKLRYWRSNKIEGLNAESTFGAGAMGLGHYVAAHLMWDLDQDADALIEDWYDSAFGVAKAPMRRMMERWASAFRLTSIELAESYHDLGEARRLAAGDPAVVRRIDDVVIYVHYLRLRLELQNENDPAAKTQKALDLVTYLLDADASLMVHTTRIVDLLSRKFPSIFEEFDLAGPVSGSSGWRRVRPLSSQDAVKLLDDGSRVYSDRSVRRRSYSRDLAPVHAAADAPRPGNPEWNGAIGVVGPLSMDILVQANEPGFHIKVSRKVSNVVTVVDESGAEVARREVAKAPDGDPAVEEELSFDLRPARYRVGFHPEGGRGGFTVRTRREAAVTLGDFRSSKGAPSPRLYFFVPRDLDRLAIYYPLGVYPTLKGFEIRDADDRSVSIDFRDNRRVLLIDVPPDQRGRIWSIDRSVSPDLPFKMLNAPQAFSQSRETLMTAREAL